MVAQIRKVCMYKSKQNVTCRTNPVNRKSTIISATSGVLEEVGTGLDLMTFDHCHVVCLLVHKLFKYQWKMSTKLTTILQKYELTDGQITGMQLLLFQ